MPDLTAKRTLVKSPPELWSELSEVERLARHLGAFGEIKITKLEPEHTVAWEGEGASGTVSIEPSGWGTKVTLTAQLPEAEATETPSVSEVVEGVTVAEPPAAETAAGEEVEDKVEAGCDEAGCDEAGVEDIGVEDPLTPVAAAERPVVEQTFVEESVTAETPAEQLEAEGPAPAVTPPAPEPVEPIGARPRRKRGFLAWLFRQRTSIQAAAPPVPTPPEPFVEAPDVKEEKSVAEKTRAEEPVEEQPGIAEDLSVAEEPVADAETPPLADAETPPLADAETPPLAEELAALDSPSTEEVAAERTAESGDEPVEAAAAEDDRLDPERAQAILDGALDALGSAHHRPFSRG
jgi:hypothetical protein